MPAKLTHRTLSAAILDRLRQAILDGSYTEGMQLRQDALAESFGVSRIPVREALFQLESEGFVQIVAHKGAVVSGLSSDEVNDIFDLRSLLEPRLLASSLPRCTPDDLAQLSDLQLRFEEAIRARDVSRWGVLNAEFHMALYARADLPRTRSIVAGLLRTSDRYTRLQLSHTEAMGIAEQEHAQLVALCRSGAVAEACAFLTAHIEAVRSDLLRVLSGRATAAPAAVPAPGVPENVETGDAPVTASG